MTGSSAGDLGGVIVAVDIGASSGRVMAGRVDERGIDLEEVHRFPNEPVHHPDGLRWNAALLFQHVLEGLRQVDGRGERVLSIGIDTWGCDIGWLDGDGELLADPFHHRDPRNDAAARWVHDRIAPVDLYARNGLQYLPFNTLYQIVAARDDPWMTRARTMLLMPDLLGYWLTGRAAAERTNASTTGLLDPRSGDWDPDLLTRIEVNPTLLPPVREPGTTLGTLLPTMAAATGLDASTPVILVGSHDTASAFVATPAAEDAALISCGTWALVGVELALPVLDDASRQAGFTNEGGVDGTIRYLHNVMGLWLLQESLRAWGAEDELTALLGAAAALPPGGPTFDADDPRFLAPGDMPERIRAACAEGGRPLDPERAHVVRAVLDSLAATFARTISAAERLTGRVVAAVHIVGGGSRNELLCQLVADATGRPVVAGPVEATAIGNLLVQARALGLIHGDLDDLRALVRASQPLRRHEPAAAPVTGGQ